MGSYATGNDNWKAYLECSCSSKEHLLVLEHSKEDGLIIHIQVFQFRNVFRRIWEAIKYVCFQTQYSASWDTMMIRSDDVQKIEEWIDRDKRSVGLSNDF